MLASVDPWLAYLGSDLARLKLASRAHEEEEEREIDDISRDLQEVESIWKGIKALLADAESVQTRDPRVRDWLLELRDLAYEIENLRDAYEHDVVAMQVEEASRAPSPPPCTITSLSPLLDASLREQISRDLRRIRQDFDAIARRSKALHLKEADGRTQSDDDDDGFVEPEPTGLLATDPVLFGRDEELRRLRELLIADHGKGGRTGNVEVIAVVGMGGLGKTALAQHVCKDPDVAQSFDEEMIKCVHASQKFDITGLTKAVVEAFSRDTGPDGLAPLQDRVMRLVAGKKVLLVVDDVWSTESWESFIAPFDQGAKEGSKILVTTRLPDVADRTATVGIINLSRLSDEDGWSLLKEHAFRYRSRDADGAGELEEIGKKIAAKCRGLPLSLKLLGGLLSYKRHEEEWRSVLESSLLDPGEGSEAKQKILGSLYLSYLHLSPQLRSCFKCCRKYENGRIRIKYLKQSWVAYDVVKDKGEASRCLDKLVSRYFLELDSYGQLGMHDDIYDLAQYVQGEEYLEFKYDKGTCPGEMDKAQFSGAQHTSITSYNVRHEEVCSVRHIDTSQTNLRSLKLRYFWFPPLKLELSPGQYLRELDIDISTGNTWLPELESHDGRQDRFKCLRVLRLPGRWKSFPTWVLQSYNLRFLTITKPTVACFPESVCDLRNLRGLSMPFSRVRCLPEAISRLTSLQELNLKRSAISCLPMSISELVNLQILNLHGCYRLTELPEGIVNLTKLGDLDIEDTGISFMPKGIGALTKLKLIVIDSKKVGLAELRKMWYLEDVRIHNLAEVVSEEDASQADMANKSHLRKLLLCWCQLRNMGYYFYRGKMILSRAGMPSVQERNDHRFADRDEQVLQRLRPHRNLEQVIIWGYRGYKLPSWMGDGSFAKLHMLRLEEINYCTSLSTIYQLPSLEELVLSFMARLQELAPKRLQSATEQQQPFPKLRKLSIYDCDGIELLPLCEFPSLEYVEVHRCSNLKHMEPPYHVPCLLKQTDIYNCLKLDFSLDTHSPQPAWKLRRA